MATSVRFRRGTTAQHATFTGAEGEITVDTTKKVAVVHDGVTAGGIPLATEGNAVAYNAAQTRTSAQKQQARINTGTGKVLLWTGSWASGDITVTDLDKYNVFMVFTLNSATPLICTNHNGYFRGIGGFTADNASANQFVFYIGATSVGTTITFGYCNFSSSPTISREVTAIYGLA